MKKSERFMLALADGLMFGIVFGFWALVYLTLLMMFTLM